MSKFLLLSHDGAGLPLAYRLQDEGHAVSVWIQEAKQRRQYDGLLTKVSDWEPSTKDSPIVLCDSVAVGIDEHDKPEDDADWSTYVSIGDELRERGLPIIGGSSIADRMELDRTWGAKLATEAGLLVPKATKFEDFEDALDFVRQEKKRYILKPHGNQATFHLYPAEDWHDMVAMLEHFQDAFPPGPFELQEFVDGQQMSIEGWWTGSKFVSVNSTFEHKPQLSEDLGPFCYDDKTEVLTQSGWKFFKDVLVSDAIAQIHPHTRHLSYVKPIRRYQRRYRGQLIQFSSRLVDLSVTPAHHMWVSQRKVNRFHFERAGLMEGEKRLWQAARWKGKDRTTFSWPARTVQFGKIHRTIPAVSIPTADWVRFLGLWIAEGHLGESSGRIVLSQATRKPAFEAILNAMPLKWHRVQKRTAISYRANCKTLYTYLKQFGHSRQKFVPEEVKVLPPRHLLAFLDGFHLGDGDTHGGQRRYHSSSVRLIGDIQEMLFKCGIASTITRDENTRSHFKSNGPLYSLEERKRTSAVITKHNKNIVEYDGMVYCLEVPTHLLVVRRNGRIAVCGNTGETGSLIFYYPQKVTKLQSDVLDKLVPLLRRYNYPPGPLDINCILNEDGAHFLEFTARFGYPALYLQMYAIEGNLGEQLTDLAEGDFEGFQLKPDKWFLGSRVWIPKWPYGETEKTLIGAPLFERIKTAHLPHLSFVDVQAKQEKLVAGGTDGELLCATVGAESIKEAQGKLYALLHDLYLYPMGWRSDLGVTALDNLVNLKRWGYWLPSER